MKSIAYAIAGSASLIVSALAPSFASQLGGVLWSGIFFTALLIRSEK